MKFRSILPALVGGVFATGSAFAADLPVRPVPLPVPAFTWTGFYSGIELGGIRGDFHRAAITSDPFLVAGVGPFPASTLSLGQKKDLNSAVVGSRGGYLQQFGMFVIGIEGGTQIFSLTERRTPQSAAPIAPLPPALIAFLPNDRAALHSGWQSTIRGRLGLAWDRFMVYGTGGVAFTNVRVDFQSLGFPPPTTGTFTKDKSLTGYTVGIGGEWAITDATSIGVEYRHTEYERRNSIAGFFPFFPGVTPFVPLRANIDFSNDAVMMTYNVRFGRIFPIFDWRL